MRNDTLLVTRGSVVQAALARNEMLQASGAMTDAAEAQALGAWTGFLPRLSLGAYQIRSTDALYGFGFKLNQRRATQADFSAPPMEGMPAPDPFGDALNHPGPSENNIMQVKLQQPVFNGGMALYGKKAADAMADAARSQHRRAEETVELHAVQAYEGLVLATAYERVMTEALATADAHVAQAQAMVDNEMVVEADLLQAKVYRDALAQRLIEVRNMVRTAGEHIKLLTALDTDLPIRADDDGAAPAAAAADLQGVARRSDLEASAKQAQAAADMARSKRGAMVPHLNLQAEKNWYHRDDLFGNEADAWTFGVYATWDVFSGLQNIGAYKQARAESRAASWMHDFQSRQARTEAVQAGFELDAARERLAVARDAVTAAREGLRIVTSMHREGLASMVDLLDVQAAATMAEGNLVQARHDVRVGLAKFVFAGGRLTGAPEQE
ncbi:TolC family protein [bacterium]|nr:TolC family protein [bacterium]HPF34696.1 TolC family protein [Candidatus Krumholzibacteria bacterium]HRX51767.1 TolC family protein [Candidatus Krumholzibacteria bacterium]